MRGLDCTLGRPPEDKREVSTKVHTHVKWADVQHYDISGHSTDIHSESSLDLGGGGGAVSDADGPTGDAAVATLQTEVYYDRLDLSDLDSFRQGLVQEDVLRASLRYNDDERWRRGLERSKVRECDIVDARPPMSRPRRQRGSRA